MYREIILNSSDFTRGDKNHPVFTFPEDIRFSKFCIRTCEFPNFYLDVPQNEMLGIVTYKANGTVNQAKYAIVQLTDFANVTALVAMLNAILTTNGANTNLFTNNPVFVVVNTYWIGLSTQFGFPWALDFGGNNALNTLGSGIFLIPNAVLPAPSPALTANNVNYVSRFLRRLFGYPESLTITPPLDGTNINDQTLGAIKATPDNYLLLRSSSMSGAMFTPNTNVSGAYSIANVVAKIPVNQGTFAYGSYVFYEVNDSPVEENMYSYNGGNTNNFDLYFTRSPVSMMNDVVDFQGWNFSVTLGIITHDTP